MTNQLPFRSNLRIRCAFPNIIVSSLLFGFAFCAWAQGPSASCMDDTVANTTTCRIDAPIVTQRITEYDGAFHPEIFLASSNDNDENAYGVQLPGIFLKKGDLVKVDANGCVQTGGSGDTWKRYLDPQGDNADRLYHGTLGFINALEPDGTTMPNPIRIQDIRLVSVWIPADQPLRLGYEDDDYSNNGYWGHDNGEPEQCNLDNSHGYGGNAFVTLTIHHYTPPPPPVSPLCWDVVAADPALPDLYDRANPFDMNALLLNPRWGWQTVPRGSDPRLLCGALADAAPDFDACPNNSACTRQLVTSDTPDTVFNGIFDGCSNGHLNWDIVSYHGKIFWSDHSASFFGDDDYNFELQTPVTNGFASGSSAPNPQQVQLEFQARETIDHFDGIPFWRDFHDAVDNNDREAHIMVDGHEAIVIGLMGLDRVHGSLTEIHPVFMLAIHVSSLPSDDTWAIFARNYGNEGWCSDNMHYATFNTVTLRLPRNGLVPSTSQATLGAYTQFLASGSDVTGWNFFSAPNQDTYITFHLPSPPADGEDGARISGELHLQWSGVSGIANSTATGAVAPPQAKEPATSSDMDPGEPEATLRNVWAQLTPQQQANYLAILPPSPAPLIDSFHLIPALVGEPPVHADSAPSLSVATDPRQHQYKQDQVMSFCGAMHGQPMGGTSSCVPGDLNGDGKVDCSDLAIVEASFLKLSGQAGFDPRADTNGDGVVDLQDVAFVTQNFSAGVQCSGFTTPSVQINGPSDTIYRQLRLTATPSDVTLTFAWRAINKSAAIINANTATPDVQLPRGAGFILSKSR